MAGSLHAAKLRPVAKCTPEQLRESCERETCAEFVAARQALGLTQFELSARLGVDRATIENWETIRRVVLVNPEPQRTEKLKALGARPDCHGKP